MPELRHRAVLAQLRSSRAHFFEQLNDWRATAIHDTRKSIARRITPGGLPSSSTSLNFRAAFLDAVAQSQELLLALSRRRPQNGEIGLALDRDRRHSHLYSVSSHRNGLATAETMLLNAQS
jgi:hypothetical protein